MEHALSTLQVHSVCFYANYFYFCVTKEQIPAGGRAGASLPNYRSNTDLTYSGLTKSGDSVDQLKDCLRLAKVVIQAK